MSRSAAKERALQKRKESQIKEQSGFWPELCRRIDAGQVIPIIGNSVYIDQIYDIDGDNILGVSPKEKNKMGWSIEEQLADIWAAQVGFPLPEQHWMPRVALFDRVVNSKDEREAKTNHLNWLKDMMLYLAEADPDQPQGNLSDLREELEQKSFADIAVELGYPKPIKNYTNPLTLLAQLNLPIYITTSPYDLLERAIIANRREPRTQVCFWSGDPVKFVDESHRTDYEFKPTPENPLVYHVFGLEAYPESMVLHEDDYLDFLAHISMDTNQKRRLLPAYIRKAITQSSLILLGYRLRDWDFRVMFRGLINTTPSGLRMFNLAIQINPEARNPAVSAEEVRDYLEKYFGNANFTVEWNSPHVFVEKMWEAWQKWQS